MCLTWRGFADHMETRVSENISVQVLNGTPQWALLSLNMWPTHIACLFPIRCYMDNFNLCNFCSLRHWKNLSWWTPVVLGWFWYSLKLFAPDCKSVLFNLSWRTLTLASWNIWNKVSLKKELVVEKGAKMGAIPVSRQSVLPINIFCNVRLLLDRAPLLPVTFWNLHELTWKINSFEHEWSKFLV